MKLSLTLVTFNFLAVLAAPQINPRQNDVPKCEDGGHAEHLKTYDSGFTMSIDAEHGADVVSTTPILLALSKPNLGTSTVHRDFTVLHRSGEHSPGNMTISFFTDDQDCESSNTITPVLTTRDTPTELICFNLTDTFSPGNKTVSGYQKALRPWEDRTSNISYYVQQNNFDSSANYTQVRYELPGNKAGETSPWVLWVYPHLNCETEVKGVDNYEYPWYEVDCQTEEGGECQELKYPIKSFAILDGDRKGECKTWAQLGTATETFSWNTRLFHAMVAIAVTFLIL
ncbi:hypothetical protein FLONG3_7879 [Fusarium longipes]|uniref:Uncharacterized protein n=1 Tax=Fusarium longipes TaxID=694270 RepID=A0A395SA04_9HYPO|nr:hypothetical protein FLONG3_7879 [Fusarium longipes]